MKKKITVEDILFRRMTYTNLLGNAIDGNVCWISYQFGRKQNTQGMLNVFRRRNGNTGSLLRGESVTRVSELKNITCKSKFKGKLYQRQGKSRSDQY